MKKIKLALSMKETLNCGLYQSSKLTIFTYNKLKPVKNHDNIFYYEDALDNYMHANLIAGLAAVKVKFLTSDGNFTYCDTILHDSSYDEFPKFVKRFLMEHEIGHSKNKDLDMDAKTSRMILIKRSFGILPNIEIEADAYAASIVGASNAKKALLFLRKRTDLPLTSKIELMRRYWKIK